MPPSILFRTRCTAAKPASAFVLLLIMKFFGKTLWLIAMPLGLTTGCMSMPADSNPAFRTPQSPTSESSIMADYSPPAKTAKFSADTAISRVVGEPALAPFGRLLFPVRSAYYGGSTLGDLKLTWYGRLQPDMTVAVVNDLYQRAAAGETIFYDIYTEAEKRKDPAKRDTGLFFFKGRPGAQFAVCSAGGGFVFVGAMQDSFPHALTLSQKGYNAFALIYRPGAYTACEDLARAIAFVFAHARELEVGTRGYSLWGGSAGARMAAWLGVYGTERFGESAYPRPAAVIMQYTGLSEVTGREPPTYSCVGDSDGIADYRIMAARTAALQSRGIEAQIEVFPGLSHGFGLGTGTAAEGWIDRAAAFWQKQIDRQK